LPQKDAHIIVYNEKLKNIQVIEDIKTYSEIGSPYRPFVGA
jgi:hypothetical protein